MQNGSQTPGFDMATMAIMGDTDFGLDPVTGATSDVFYGLVAVDQEGWVVWYYHMLALESWDFVPGSYDIVLQAENSGNLFGDPTMSGQAWKGVTPQPDNLGRDRHWLGNSQMQWISPLGELRQRYLQACSGRPLNYNQISHECRADGSSGEVLTTMYDVRHFADVWAGTISATGVSWAQYDSVVGQSIVRWDPVANKIDVVYDMFDFASPDVDIFESAAWTSTDLACSGPDTVEALDYHHVSSVSVSATTGDYIVASRNLDTVWCLARDGSGAVWTLSSSMPWRSDYAFERPLDMFFQPHSVLQLDGGDLLVVDDGAQRPGCRGSSNGTTDGAGCWSRVAQYNLGADMIARVVWQFEFPYSLDTSSIKTVEERDLFNAVGGSVYQLSNGNFLIGFTSVSDNRKYDPAATSYAFEIAVSQNAEADDAAAASADDALAASAAASNATAANASASALDNATAASNATAGYAAASNATASNATAATSAVTIVAEMLIPTPIVNVDRQNGYRFVPWRTINGERPSKPAVPSR